MGEKIGRIDHVQKRDMYTTSHSHLNSLTPLSDWRRHKPGSRQLFLVHTCLAERYLNVLRSRHAVGRKVHATNQQVWSAQGCWHACQEPSKEAKTCVEGDIREGVGAGRCQRRRECRWWRLISACCHTFPGVSQGLVFVTFGAATLFLNVNNLDTMIFLINLPRHRYDLS